MVKCSPRLTHRLNSFQKTYGNQAGAGFCLQRKALGARVWQTRLTPLVTTPLLRCPHIRACLTQKKTNARAIAWRETARCQPPITQLKRQPTRCQPLPQHQPPLKRQKPRSLRQPLQRQPPPLRQQTPQPRNPAQPLRQHQLPLPQRKQPPLRQQTPQPRNPAPPPPTKR